MSYESLDLPLERPVALKPIDIVGAGGIVRDGHLPAYRKEGLPVRGVYDKDRSRAESLAAEWNIPHVYASVEDIPSGGIFDVAVPAEALDSVIQLLPAGSVALLQKPFGSGVDHAQRLLALLAGRRILASVNFQLRYSPAVRLARRILTSGAVGDLHDIEVRVNVHTPWELWRFLESAPGVEILYHSIHYIDLIRSFWGDPVRVHAFTGKHPSAPNLHSTRSVISLDYGPWRRATVTAYHGHRWGAKNQESYVKWEGTRGAIRATLGVLQNYPVGLPDVFEVCTDDHDWIEVPVNGRWYPDAFAGPMLDLQRAATGDILRPSTHVEDAFRTMAIVDAAYRDSATGGTVPY